MPSKSQALSSKPQTPDSLNCFLVGGAVRDQLLGLPVSDRDWVVVGATPQRMQELGYQAVGQDFPVFLHPHSKEEYALARTERKVSVGYHGFTFNADPTITLAEDLQRRDLTINAIARSPTGDLIDPYNGISDLKNKQLRHVSDAFVEDPLRVLRVARFSAQLAHLGFEVAAETIALMNQIGGKNELHSLTPERVFTELRKALNTHTPGKFFDTLRKADVLVHLFPEIDALFGVPQPAQHHPEIDSGVHTLMVLDQTCQRSGEDIVRFASLCHDLGKATTPNDILPGHHGHEKRGAVIAADLCTRLKAPKRFSELAVLTARFHTHCHRALELRPGSLLTVIKSFDALRRPERWEQFLIVCEADSRGRLGFENRPYPQADYFRHAVQALDQLNYGEIAGNVSDKSRIADAIRKEQLIKLTGFRHNYADAD